MIFFYLAILAVLSLFAWLFILLYPARPWDLRPIAEDEPEAALPAGLAWPPATIIVPARNEAVALPQTLPPLLAQDYAGPCRIILVDDRSTDGTAAVAEEIAERLQKTGCVKILKGAPLPAGWSGKVWALDQGLREALSALQADASFFLFTDADIQHAPSMLRRLAAESLAQNLGLNSRLARLRCASVAEKLLIPAFVFFFNLLYPMRRVNDPGQKIAAAAGGCMLLSGEALRRLGGSLSAIQGEIIDDVNLARQVKAKGLAVRLSVSRGEVRSLREYGSLAEIWRMVRRTAFSELKFSWMRLAVALAVLGLLFVVPGLAIAGGALALGFGHYAFATAITPMAAGLLALLAMRIVYGPAVAYFELPARYAYLLPVAGVLYGLMTLDSAQRHARGMAIQWRSQQ